MMDWGIGGCGRGGRGGLVGGRGLWVGGWICRRKDYKKGVGSWVGWVCGGTGKYWAIVGEWGGTMGKR